KISRDLTESKALQDALREREELHRLLIDNARDFAIMMIDLNGTIASWNSGAERVFGFTETEAVGQKTAILFTAEDRAEGVPVKELATASSEGRAIDERWQIRKGGERFWASGVTTPLRDAVGGTRGFVKICRDLTERKQFEDQRNRLLEQEQIARLEAEQAVRMKDEFLAVISHELRTPLTSILLWAKLLRSGTVKAAGEPEALRAIEQGAVAQQQLIEDLLDMSRIISGKLRLNVQQADFSPVVRSAVDTLRPMADAKGVRIHIALDDGLDPVRIDPDRMQQVVWNLVSNAVKFTDKGGSVRVTASRHDDRVVLKVTDTGRGISPGFLPFIFDSFRQADSGTTRGYGGLGLGMAITRQLVELHGGTARAESEGEGKGATFSVELPQTVILSEETPTTRPPVKADSKTAGEPLPHLDGVRLLLVEDEVGARTALQWLLERSGAEVTAVESAVRAVDAFRDALREPHPFNVIVSDIGMPIMDGYEMIGHLRSLEHQAGAAAPTPAIALTAFARVEDCAKAKKAGYQMHVAKPIEPGRLVSLVANVLQTTP
ncbi:MAG TPA: ATP-binding protein, partial [Tepidisphaeraceae bacterium]